MRKALKKGVRTDCTLTIKLIPALRLNAEFPPKKKQKTKPPLLCFGSGALSKFFLLELLCKPPFLDLILTLYQLL